jgi:hypothetical protein
MSLGQESQVKVKVDMSVKQTMMQRVEHSQPLVPAANEFELWYEHGFL